MRIAIVINKDSGRKYRPDKMRKLINGLSKIHQVQTLFASQFDELDKVGLSVKNGFDLVIVCGGDGTASRISHHLVNTGIPVLIVPAGSGNDFASHLNMSNSIDKVFENIAKFETKKINVISVNNGESTCTTICCFAFEARVNRIASGIPRMLGKFKYTLATFIALLGKNYVEIEINSSVLNEINSYSLAIIANSPSFGGGMKISNRASVEADDLYLILVNRVSKIKLIYLFLLLLAGRHYGRKEFRQFPIREIKVKGVGSILKPQIDGDSLPEGDIEAKLLRQSLTVLVCN
ncbi:MAG: hypothetical protein RIS18_912 [Actinomycetota bacterium]